jgi:hypothetical protein
MENTSEDGAARRKPWPSQKGIREVAGSKPSKRRYLSDRVSGLNKLEKPQRTEIKAQEHRRRNS